MKKLSSFIIKVTNYTNSLFHSYNNTQQHKLNFMTIRQRMHTEQSYPTAYYYFHKTLTFTLLSRCLSWRRRDARFIGEPSPKPSVNYTGRPELLHLESGHKFCRHSHHKGTEVNFVPRVQTLHPQGEGSLLADVVNDVLDFHGPVQARHVERRRQTQLGYVRCSAAVVADGGLPLLSSLH